MPTITPHLWYDKEAYEAAELYVSVFPDSRIIGGERFDDTGPDESQTVTTVHFEISGQRVIGLNAGPHHPFNDAFSFFVECEDQAEVDAYWDRLTTDGGQEVQCGWLKDRFGVSWQIVPKLLGELLGSDDQAKSQAAMHAMLQMKKIDCAALQEAYDNAGA